MAVFIVPLLVSLLAFVLSVLLIFYARRRRSTDIFRRLRRHLSDIKEDPINEDIITRLRKFIKRTAQPLTNWSFVGFFDLKLRQAGLPLLGGEFIIIVLLGASIVGLVVYMLMLDRIVAVIAGVSVPIALWAAVLVLISRRRTAFTEQLGDCLITVANALRAGYSFQQAMDVIAKEMEPPIGDEFAHVTNDIARGLTLENALEQMNRRVGSDDFDLVVTAVLIQREVGGNLAQILDTISDTINDRIRMKREIMALTAQGRFSALVLLALPFVTAGMMYTVNRDNFMMLFTEPMGQMAIAASLVMEVIGYFVIQKIVDIDT